MKRTIYLILAVCILLLSVPLNAGAKQNSFSWYCKRMKNNAQPPLPEEFNFIEDYPCIWLDKSGSKKVYLTFDAGYENGNVEKILSVLDSKGVKAAFFILLNLIETNPELVKRMYESGHLVCNHTAYHKNISKITDPSEIKKELDILEHSYLELTGNKLSPYFRPPEGTFIESNLKTLGDLGYTTVFWSFAYADWDNNNQPSAEYAKNKILENLHDGAVILLHPTSATNAAVLGEIIDAVKSKGYEFGTLDEITSQNNCD